MPSPAIRMSRPRPMKVLQEVKRIELAARAIKRVIFIGLFLTAKFSARKWILDFQNVFAAYGRPRRAVSAALTSACIPSNLPRVDTMKLLLGATVALLLGALAVSWQGMRRGVENASPDEIARLKKQVTELRQEQDKLQLERQLQQLKSSAPAAATPESNAAQLEAMKAEVELNKARLAQIEVEKAEAEKASRDAKLAQDEEGLLTQRDLEKGDSELRRARLIGEALLIGRVRDYVAESGFITFDILMPEQVQNGTVLALRRKTGILGQFTVSDVTPEGGVADQLPGIGRIDPKPGDELILPPP